MCLLNLFHNFVLNKFIYIHCIEDWQQNHDKHVYSFFRRIDFSTWIPRYPHGENLLSPNFHHIATWKRRSVFAGETPRSLPSCLILSCNSHFDRRTHPVHTLQPRLAVLSGKLPKNLPSNLRSPVRLGILERRHRSPSLTGDYRKEDAVLNTASTTWSEYSWSFTPSKIPHD